MTSVLQIFCNFCDLLIFQKYILCKKLEKLEKWKQMYFLNFFFSDELLPLIHLSWQPLRVLFVSENLFIVTKAFSVLRVLAKCSGDFIRKRTLTDALPPLLKYISRLQVITL